MSNPEPHRNSKLSMEARQRWMSRLARADGVRLAALWDAAALSPNYDMLRAPEIGAVMTRGRAGGDGAAFNLGEATATRCSVRLQSGEEGHAYALGRDKRKARISALCDALMQTDAADHVRTHILSPLESEETARREDQARKAAATKVEFFTMTRGDD